MTDSKIEINEDESLQEGEQENSTKEGTATRETRIQSLMSTLKKGYSHIGIFGYNFKGPEKFGNSLRAELLNSQILEYIDNNYRWSHELRKTRKTPKRNSLGIIESLNEMTAFPLRFNNQSLEELYSLNLNDWIVKRMPFITFICLLINLIFWPLCVTSFQKSGAWKNEPYISTLFHIIMAITSVSVLVPLISILIKFRSRVEIMCYTSIGLVVILWGTWKGLASYSLPEIYSKGDISELMTAREALKTLIFIYGILPIVALDTFLPTRTSKTIPIHLLFSLFYSISTFTSALLYSTYVPWIYVVIRISAFITIICLLYLSSYHFEIQTRVTFYEWLINSRKISRLECDLEGIKSPEKVGAPAELILENVKMCLSIAYHMREASYLRFPEILDSLEKMCKTMKKCITQITNTNNLYSVSTKLMYKNIGEGADIVESYIKSYCNPDKITHSMNINPKINKVNELAVSLDSSVNFYRGEPSKVKLLEGLDKYLGNISEVQSRVTLNQLINDWNFNIFEHFKEETHGFVTLGSCLLSEFQDHFKVPQSIIFNFLGAVESLYKNVAYHNCIHGGFVAQKICCLSNYIGLYDNMSVLDRAVLTVSALCHDVGHPGKTNSFFVNSKHDLAHLFNDRSILENFHSCLTFKVLKIEECNIFSFLEPEVMRQVRHRIIELILATDMENHFESISRFRLRRNSSDFSLRNDTLNICKMLIKASDIGSTCISWDMSVEWIQRLFCEFYSQGELEKSLDLPVSALCDVNRHLDLPKAQIGFLRFVVDPLYKEISQIECNLLKTSLVKSGQGSRGRNTNAHLESILIPKFEKNCLNFGFEGSNSEGKNRRSCVGALKDLPEGSEGSDENLIEDDKEGEPTVRFSDDSKACKVCSSEFESETCSSLSNSNRISSICLFHLSDNVKRWEQMAQLGQSVPFNCFQHDDVNLDIQLAIQSHYIIK